MSKRKSYEWEDGLPGPSKIFTERDEQNLAKWFLASIPTFIVIGIVIGAFVAL